MFALVRLCAIAFAACALVACAGAAPPPSAAKPTARPVDDCARLAAAITKVFDAGGDSPRAQRAAVAEITRATYETSEVRGFAADYARALAAFLGSTELPTDVVDDAARGMMGVVEARRPLEDACGAKTTKTTGDCAQVNLALADAANLDLTDARGIAALVARLQTVHLLDPALMKSFAAFVEAERVLASIAPGLSQQVEAFAPRFHAGTDAIDDADRRFEALCGPAPWRSPDSRAAGSSM